MGNEKDAGLPARRPGIAIEPPCLACDARFRCRHCVRIVSNICCASLSMNGESAVSCPGLNGIDLVPVFPTWLFERIDEPSAPENSQTWCPAIQVSGTLWRRAGAQARPGRRMSRTVAPRAQRLPLSAGELPPGSTRNATERSPGPDKGLWRPRARRRGGRPRLPRSGDSPLPPTGRADTKCPGAIRSASTR